MNDSNLKPVGKLISLKRTNPGAVDGSMAQNIKLIKDRRTHSVASGCDQRELKPASPDTIQSVQNKPHLSHPCFLRHLLKRICTRPQ
jgi:hypothetical protein